MSRSPVVEWRPGWNFEHGRHLSESLTRLLGPADRVCSIAGLVGCGDPSVLAAMSSSMAHRGPDGSGQVWFDDRKTGLAHNRLAILDLSDAGSQPMADATGRHWIVFNGEIYNYRELRDELRSLGHSFKSASDTEVLLAALIEWQHECLNRLDGMFAFAWFDRATRRLFAARDQLGIKPFYYAEAHGGLAFASETKALLQCRFVAARRDDRSMLNPSRFMLSGDTGFAGIGKLPPAHCLTYHDGKLDLHQYWKIDPSEQIADAGRACAQVGELIERAVETQMVSDRPIGTFLSGGLDSSLVSALMRRHTNATIDAFTIKFSSTDQLFEGTPDDSFYARQVARQFGFNLHEIELEPNVTELLPLMVWHMDEPLSDPAAINTYLISRAARDLGIVVLLNGIGGDEIFGGYRKYLACLHAGTYQSMIPRGIRQLVAKAARRLPVATTRRGLPQLRDAKRFLGYANLPEPERFLASDLSLNAEMFSELYNGADYFASAFWQRQHATLQGPASYLTKMCLNDTLRFLPDHNLTYSDKAGMAAGTEARQPLVSKNIVTSMFQVSPQLRIHGNVQKYLLKEIGARHLSRDVVDRRKASFKSPLRSWIRGPLSGLVDAMLSEASIRSRGLYDPKTVARLVREDREGLADHSMWIWNMITVELWHQTFLDRPACGPVTL